MILSEEFLPRIAGDLAKLVVDVRDPAGHIGRGDNSGLVERSLEIGELAVIGQWRRHPSSHYLLWRHSLHRRLIP
jgi:hypothetical protein